MYIPYYVNPRVEDILRGYIAQRILWELNANLIFIHTTTYTSNRNAHDFLKDFSLELPLYLEVKRLIQILDSISLSSDIIKSLFTVYTKLAKSGFVKKEELVTLKGWIKEIEKYL